MASISLSMSKSTLLPWKRAAWWRHLSTSCRDHNKGDSLIDIPVESKLPSQASVVVAGAGLIGNSVAYHLVERGWKDVVIIDKGNIADGTSK